jgi:hypothetical protein
MSKYSKEAHERADNLEKRAKQNLKNQCATCDEPVIYHGWDGSIHTFEFGNHQYAKSFVQANKGKVLS